jgi:hypothetical protein
VTERCARGTVVPRFKFLIRGRDSTFTSAFDDVFSGNSTRVLKTPVAAGELMRGTVRENTSPRVP